MLGRRGGRPDARKSSRQPPLYHCNAGKFDFTVKTGAILHDSKLPLDKGALAFYLFSTNCKVVSSIKLHRNLGITQKSDWYMAHRIRETWSDPMARFAGPLESDETCISGQERKSASPGGRRPGAAPWARRRRPA